jgi:hypothetical protein
MKRKVHQRSNNVSIKNWNRRLGLWLSHGLVNRGIGDRCQAGSRDDHTPPSKGEGNMAWCVTKHRDIPLPFTSHHEIAVRNSINGLGKQLSAFYQYVPRIWSWQQCCPTNDQHSELTLSALTHLLHLCIPITAACRTPYHHNGGCPWARQS